jgi:biotin operon repressor
MSDLNEEIRKLKEEGLSLRQIAAALGVTHVAVLKRLRAIEESRKVVTNGSPSLMSGAVVTTHRRPRGGPHRHSEEGYQQAYSGSGDLLSTIREALEAKGIEMYRMESDAYEGYQIKHNQQIIRFYVQRKIGVDRAKEETE